MANGRQGKYWWVASVRSLSSVVNWNRLPSEMVDAQYLSVFQRLLDNAFYNIL